MIRLTLVVPATGPLYEGHFPGRPILPGVGLLDLAVRALATAGASGPAATATPPALRGVAALRLRRPVLPGEILAIEALEIDAQPHDAGRTIRFEIRRGVERVADGVFAFGEPSAAVVSSARFDSPASPSARIPDLDELVPHRPPMRFIQMIETERDDGVVCTARVTESGPFAERGAAPALVTVEMAAQAAAAHEALRRRRAGGEEGPRPGYLVGARDVRFGEAGVHCGEIHRVSLRLAAAAPPLTTYAFEVSGARGTVAVGSISTWLSPTDA